MAAAFKTSKSELVAIYRLEFYKKQKNWKFCSAERKKEEEKKRAAKNVKAKLNQTYSIEPAPEKHENTAKTETEKVTLDKETEQAQLEAEQQKEDAEPVSTEERTDNLNEAFVDTETDDNVTTPLDNPPTGPYTPRWSIQQWAARCRPSNRDPTPPLDHNDPSPHVLSDPSRLNCVQSEPSPPYHGLTDPTRPYCVPSDPSDPSPPYYVPSDPRQQYCVPTDPSPPYYGLSDPTRPYCVPSDPSPPYYIPSDPRQPHCVPSDRSPPYYIPSDPRQPHCVPSDPSPPYYIPSDPTRPTCVENSMDLGQVLTDYETNLIYKRKEVCGTTLSHGANMLDPELPRGEPQWMHRQEGWFEEICDIPEDAIEAIEALEVGDGDADAVDGAERALLRRAGRWLRSASSLDQSALPRSDSLLSVSSGSFTRGAALAPHSTELDLAAAALTAPALAAAVAGHAAALAQLLGEARRRQPQVSPPPPPRARPPAPPAAPPAAPSPPAVYTHNPTVVSDVFVAGSFRNRPDLSGHTEGRGRGRKVRVVGLEMGRPYRL